MIEILFIILGAVVCLAGILGGTALIMRIAERKYLRNLDKAESTISEPINILDSLSIEDQYQGKLIAISNGPQKKVIASADNYSDLIKEAGTVSKNPFCVVFVPSECVIYCH